MARNMINENSKAFSKICEHFDYDIGNKIRYFKSNDESRENEDIEENGKEKELLINSEI